MTSSEMPKWNDEVSDEDVDDKIEWGQFPDSFKFRANDDYIMKITQEPIYAEKAPYSEKFVMLIEHEGKENSVWCGKSIRDGLGAVQKLKNMTLENSYLDYKDVPLVGEQIKIRKLVSTKHKRQDGEPVEFFKITWLQSKS